jgi:hypothetical protein
MTVEKTFGFGNSSPYNSFTFNKNNDIIVGRNGPMQIGSITNDLPNVLLQDITFVQNGVFVKKIGNDSVTFPSDLPVPFYLTATVPDTQPLDNIIWGFVRRPQDIGENVALIAEWDGQEWRHLDKLSIAELIKERLLRAQAYGNLGFNTGFRFSPNVDFSEYVLTKGQVTDKSGQLITKNTDTQFDEIPADDDFDRIDAIIWRRLQDDPNRIGFPDLKPGNTFSGTDLEQVKLNTIVDDTIVNSKPKIINLDDNTFIMFYVEKYGVNGELKAVKYDSDRTTQLVAPTILETNVLDYDISVSPGGTVNIAFIRGGDLLRMKIDQSDLTTTISAAAVDGLTNPCSKPKIVTDYLGNQHIMFLYQQAPTIFSPYYLRLNVGGTVATAAFRLRANSDNYSSVDFEVNSDLELFTVYSNTTDGTIEYQKLDEFGEELTEIRTISDDTYNKDADAILVGNARNAKIKVAENNEVYVTFEQDKGASVFGLCIWAERLINDEGHKALLLTIDAPSENIENHHMELDWQNHGHILYSTGSDLRYFKYWLPALNTRLLGSFQVNAVNSLDYDMVYDKSGALLQVFADEQAGTTNNGGTITNFKTGAGTFGGEAVFLASNQIAVLQSDLDALDPVPTIGDSFTLAGSLVGNDGTYLIENQKTETISGNTYSVFTLDQSFSGSVDSPGSTIQFTELQGNDLKFAKQTAAISYGFTEVFAEELNSDIIAVLVRKSDSAFVTWYENSRISADTTYLRTENSLGCSGDISWDAVTDNGTLVWSEIFHIIDPFRGTFEIPAGSINNVVEGDVLFINLPKAQFFLEDGDGDVAKITSVADFSVGQKVFVGDSDSFGLVTTVASTGIGEITLDDDVSAFTKVRGAYIIPLELELKKAQQNEGLLRPSSLGEIDSSIYVIATRKDNYMYFRDGGLQLEDGETGQIGDGTSNENLLFIGAASEADSQPKYSTALGGTIPNFKVVENESLLRSIKRLDSRDDNLPRVDLIDLVNDALPTTAPTTIDGVTLTTGVKVFFPEFDEGVYEATVSGGSISWTKLAPFGGSETPVDGSTLKVRGGDTDYLRTIWERVASSWAPVHVKEATQEPSGFKYEDLNQSFISFDNGTRTFTIEPTNDHFDYFIKGKVYRKTEAQSVQIPDVEGSHFVYFDGDTLVSTTGFNIDLILNKAYIANLYWDSDNQEIVILGEERHGITMDGATHRYLHNTRGTRLKEGFGIDFDISGDGSADEDVEIQLGSGILYDEDLILNIVDTATPTEPLEQTLSPVAKLPVYYRDGVNGNWRKDTATDFPVKQGSSRIQYNTVNYSVWQQLDVPADGQFTSMWLIATNNILEPVIAVLGQAVHDDLSTAQELDTYSSLSTGDLPFVEFKVLYRLIFETDSSFTNTSKAALRDVQDLRVGEDSPFPSVSPSDHGLLSGLNDPDHGPRAVTTSGVEKDGGLSDSDTDVFESLDTINKLLGQLRIKPHPSDGNRVIITGASRILNSGTTIIQELRNLVLEFDGAEIDFSTGVIYESDGTTPLGDPFTPVSIPTSEYHTYSITLLPNVANESLNTITGQLIIIPGPDSNAVKANTPKPAFANGTKLGYVIVQENAGNIAAITEADINQLGTGGGGGSGSGDASGLEERIKNRANLTEFGFAHSNVFQIQQDELVDETSTAGFSIVSSSYNFENPGDILLTSNILESVFYNERLDLDRAEFSVYVNPEASGSDATFETSIDGGNNWQSVSLSQIGSSDVLRGSVIFDTDIPDTFTFDAGGTQSGTTQFTDVVEPSGPYNIDTNANINKVTANITVVGSPAGIIYAEARLDNGGAPTGEEIARSKFLSIGDLSSGDVDFDFGYRAIPEDAHIVFKTDTTYKGTYTNSSGADRIEIDNDGSNAIFTLSGRELDLRFRATRGTEELEILGIGTLYLERFVGTVQYGDVDRHLESFDGTADNFSVFDVPFPINPRTLMIFEIGTGQVYRYGLQGFLINGQGQVVFEQNTFQKAGTVTLEFIQFLGSTVEVGSDVLQALAASNIGAPGFNADFLQPGRGHFFRRPDGVIRELVINDNDEIEIYSVD